MIRCPYMNMICTERLLCGGCIDKSSPPHRCYVNRPRWAYYIKKHMFKPVCNECIERFKCFTKETRLDAVV